MENKLSTQKKPVKQLTIESGEESNSENVIISAGYDCPTCSGNSPGHFSEHLNEEQKSQSEENRIIAALLKISLGGILFFIALLADITPTLEFVLFLLSYLLVGGDVLLHALRNLMRGKVFDENFLMSIATIGAFAIKEYPEGVAVMLFYQIGEFFNSVAINRSRKSISDLMDIRPDYANLIVRAEIAKNGIEGTETAENGIEGAEMAETGIERAVTAEDGIAGNEMTGDEIRKVKPQEVRVGDLIIVKPGEKIPLDGKVSKGRSSLNVSALTGESVPREVEEGNEVLSGSININGLLTVEVTRNFGESTVSKILELVQNAGSKKAPTEKFITKFAKFYTPAVVFSALALAIIPPIFIPGAEFSDWLYRALLFLVVSCPCALVVSIPLGFFGGIGGASRHGILVKGSNYLEALTNIDTVVFDKTGTLTKGVFKVSLTTSEGRYTDNELLEFAAYAESFSGHPIAVSILKRFGVVQQEKVEDYEEIPGYGVKIKMQGREIFAGNRKLMNMENIKVDEAAGIGTVVYIAIDGVYEGSIMISDEVREDSKKAIDELKSLGINKTVMLTGDSRRVATAIGNELGLDEVYAELLPDEKVEQLEILEKQQKQREQQKGQKKTKKARGKLLFVGDGINDAPVLTRADVGIAMGALGSDAAIEAADIVLMNDEPLKLVKAINIARKTRRIVWQNIIFALVVKAAVLVIGSLGMTTMWSAVFADVGVTFIAVLNSMRALK